MKASPTLRIRLPAASRAIIAADAERRHPEEACGALLGRTMSGGVEVVEAVPLPNAHSGDRRRRYALEPEALLAVHKNARGQGLRVVGYYHSHPDGTAVPSRTDREFAWPGTSYVLVAVTDGAAREVRSWRVVGEDDRDSFVEETIE